MLRSTELNTFSMTKPIYRDVVCRANGGIYRLSGKTIRNNDETAFLGLQWNSIINQPQVYKFNLILYLVSH